MPWTRPTRALILLTLSVFSMAGTTTACKTDDQPSASGSGASATTAGTVPTTSISVGPAPAGFCEAVKAFRIEVNRVYTPPADQAIDNEAVAKLPQAYAAVVDQAPPEIREGMKLGEPAASGAAFGVADNAEWKAKVKLADSYILKECNVQLFGTLDAIDPSGTLPNPPEQPSSSVSAIPGKTVPG